MAMWLADEWRLGHWSRLVHGDGGAWGSAHWWWLVAGGATQSGLEGDRAERMVGSMKKRKRAWLRPAVADKARWWTVQLVGKWNSGRRETRGDCSGRSVGNAACARRGSLGSWAHEGFGWWTDYAGTVAVGRAQFQCLNILFQYFYYSKFEKYKSCTSCSPNFSKLYQVVYNFKRDNSTFGKKFRLQTEFELKIWEVNCKYSVWIFKGVQTFEKHFLNSPKFFLNMIFNTVNLDWLTCIQKI
jgi:hypothetical protein